LGFGAASELLPLRLALIIGSVAALLTAAMLVQMLLLRWRTRRLEKRRQAVAERWRPLMLAAAIDAVPPLPPLAARDAWAFILLWQQIAEGLRGEARTRLRELARQAGMAAVARRWLRGTGAARRLMALAMLGHLGDPADWDALRAQLGERRPDLSLMAARALVLSDAQRALPDVVAQLLTRTDWPVSRVASLLREAGAELACAPVLALLQQADDEALLRLLPLLAVIDEQEAAEAVSAVLQRVKDPQVLAAALAGVNAPAALPAVRALARHPAWSVRAEVASALLRIGNEADRETLQRLMGDREWWVRYHAARAFVGLPGTTAQAVARLREGLGDRFARDMLQQVLAEQRLQ